MDPELESALAEAKGSYAIIRKGRRYNAPSVRKFGGTKPSSLKAQLAAHRAWARLDVREGWAALVDPDGKTIATESGPFGVRSKW